MDYARNLCLVEPKENVNEIFMTTLFNKFVAHYTSVSSKIRARRFYERSWGGVDRGDEVKAVRRFLLDKNIGVDYLNKNISTMLSTGMFHVKFASLFCHKKPRVQRTLISQTLAPGNTDGCELGDLFVLFVLMDSADKLHYSAGALFQAKLHQKLDSLSQKYLYDVDKDFEVPEYLAKRISPPQKIRLMPTYEEGRARALRYLILSPGCSEKNIKVRHTPWGNNYQRRWSTFLDGLLSGTDGLRTEPGSTSPSSWDMIVADLLSVGLMVPPKKPPRGNDIAVQVATSLFNNFKNLDKYSIEAGNDYCGVPTLMIIAHAPEYREQG